MSDELHPIFAGILKAHGAPGAPKQADEAQASSQPNGTNTITTQEASPPAESGASGTDGQGPLSVARSARDEHIPPPNPVSHEGK